MKSNQLNGVIVEEFVQVITTEEILNLTKIKNGIDLSQLFLKVKKNRLNREKVKVLLLISNGEEKYPLGYISENTIDKLKEKYPSKLFKFGKIKSVTILDVIKNLTKISIKLDLLVEK